jgi:alpha-ketoglutarate-dependent taurine dioxygenase
MNIYPLFSNDEHHPIVVAPRGDTRLDALRDYLQTHAAEIEQCLHRHGGILFRGFDVHSAEDFRAVTEALGAKSFGYVGGDSPRSAVAADVYTSTDHPASEVISMHNEMSYLPSYPRRLFFYSLQPAEAGGQTSLASGRDIMRALPSDLVGRLQHKKINYIRNFQAKSRVGKSWADTYQVTDRAEIEKIVAQQGSTCAWLSDSLRVSTLCEALAVHPDTGEEIWFNQAEQWHSSALDAKRRDFFEQLLGKGNLPHECEYGDGEPMEGAALAEVRRVMQANKLLFDWQRGDVLMIDNILMMHGREAFKGERKTLAYLSVV